MDGGFRDLVLTLLLGVGTLAPAPGWTAEPAQQSNPAIEAFSPDLWRAEQRIVDMHMHVEGRPERFERAVRIMNASGVGIGVALGSGTVTNSQGDKSEFERVQDVANNVAPGRFLHFMLLDYDGWDDPQWSQRAARQVERGFALGAAGLKEYKRLGLTLRDGQGQLIRIDDPKLDPVWEKCGELGMPVSIHVADPKAFWDPLDATNERWAELKDHPNWWFGDPQKYPPREALLEALSRVIARHPKTQFIAVHFANNAEDLEWVDRALTKYPNMTADLAARIPEIGRHPPEKVRELFVKHQDQIVYASDFMVYDRLILGSAGDDERPTDNDGYVFYRKCWRYLETDDEDWVHMTPIQGDWTISSVRLPPAVLRKIYFDNARQLLARCWPLPRIHAQQISRDFLPDGLLDEPEWATATPARVEYAAGGEVKAWPRLSTVVRALWTDQYLYLSFVAPYEKLTTAPRTAKGEPFGLWEYDVVEFFAAPDPDRIQQYTEYEWAPNGEQLDLKIDGDEKDFGWESGMESATTIDSANKVWRTEVRIPMGALSQSKVQVGTRWRINLYRHDKASEQFLAWSPTLTGSAHTPAKFGWLEFH